MEIGKGAQTLIGFPALIDLGDAVTIEVFDEPDVAAAKHRAGLRRLFSLQIKDALKYLEKNLPDLQKMATSYMLVGRAADNSGGGTLEELRQQIIEVALDRAFLLDPLPTCEADFKKRVDDGRGRLTLIASEVARLAGAILTEFAVAQRKIKDTKNAPEAGAGRRAAAAAPGAQEVPDRHALRRSCSISPATSRPSRCGWKSGAPTRPATPPAWPNCGRRSSATGAWWPSARARRTRACRNSAGCSKSCA